MFKSNLKRSSRKIRPPDLQSRVAVTITVMILLSKYTNVIKTTFVVLTSTIAFHPYIIESIRPTHKGAYFRVSIQDHIAKKIGKIEL